MIRVGENSCASEYTLAQQTSAHVVSEFLPWWVSSPCTSHRIFIPSHNALFPREGNATARLVPFTQASSSQPGLWLSLRLRDGSWLHGANFKTVCKSLNLVWKIFGDIIQLFLEFLNIFMYKNDDSLAFT